MAETVCNLVKNAQNGGGTTHLTGTTFNDLWSAISGLTDEQYAMSKVMINGGDVYSPYSLASKSYAVFAMLGSTSYTVAQIILNSSGCTQSLKATSGAVTTSSVTITSWDLFY